MIKKTTIYLSSFLIALTCGFLMFQSMPWGPWAYNDSAAYVSAARNFADGNGVVILHSTGKIKQLTEFPPFYPIFLSLIGGVNGDYINIVRWLNSILFSLAIFVFFLILYENSKNYLLSLFGTITFFSFHVIVKAFSGFMSEPLFLFLLFSVLYFLLRYFNSDNKPFWFFLLIIFSAVLPITRYAGILFVGIFGISIFLFDVNCKITNKIIKTAVYLVVSFTPTIIWVISLIQKFNKFAGKRFSLNREFINSLYNSTTEIFNLAKNWTPYVDLYTGSFISEILIFATLLFFIVLLVSPFLLPLIQKVKSKYTLSPFSITITFTIIGYIFLVTFMRTTSSPPIHIINRTLLPLIPLTIISASYFINSVLSLFAKKQVPALVMIFTVLIIIRFNLYNSIAFKHALAENGLGYTSKELQQSGLIDEINLIADNGIMVSNLSGFVLFHTNRYPIQIENFPQYSFGSGTAYGELEFREKRAALIILKSEFSNYYGDSAIDLYHNVTKNLTVSYEDNEGSIFYYK